MSQEPGRVTTKLFISKLPDTARKIDLQKLCEQYGKVVECDFVNKYAFVHFSSPEEAAEAVKNLDNTIFQGSRITVQFSNSPVRTKPGMGQSSACYRCGKYGHWSRDCPMAPEKVTTKLYVSKLPDTVRKVDLQKLCEKYGKVVECDFVNKYAFVHFSSPEEAAEAVKNLDNTIFQGSRITVQFSNSPVRTKPGMGQSSACYRCGMYGHWSRDCPRGPQNSTNMPRSADPDPHEVYRQDYYSQDLYSQDPYTPIPYTKDPYTQDPYAQDLYMSGYLAPALMERPRGAVRYDPYTRRLPPTLPVPAASPPVAMNSMYTIDPYSRPPPEYYQIPTVQSTRPR